MDPKGHYSCGLCNEHLIKVRVFLKADKGPIFLMRCASCHSQYLCPQPDDELLSFQYKDYFFRRSFQLKDFKERYFKIICSHLPTDFKFHSVLEVGSGEGSFLREILRFREGIEITAVEPGLVDVDYPLSVTVVNSTIEEWLAGNNTNSFDLIVMLDVVEHLRNPFLVLESLFSSHLNIGGMVLVTTPSAGSISNRILRDRWPHYKLEHLWYASQKAIEIIECKYGLSRVKLGYHVKTLPIGYLMQVFINFSAKSFGLVGRFVRSMIPRWLLCRIVTLPSGELIWIARKDDR